MATPQVLRVVMHFIILDINGDESFVSQKYYQNLASDNIDISHAPFQIG